MFAVAARRAGSSTGHEEPPPPPPQPAPAASLTDQSNIDLAYGAYQRGFYLTAFNEAAKRAQQNDPAAMTLLGEIYAQGLGVGRDDAKAAQWYKLAAEPRRPRRACSRWRCSISQGRAGAHNPDEGAHAARAAAKLGHAGAAYDLGLLYLQGQQFPQDFKRAAELFSCRRRSRQSGSAIRARHHVQRRPRRAEGHEARRCG